MKLADFWHRRAQGTVTGAGVVAVTPHDTNPIVAGEVALGFRVNVAGTVAFKCPDASTGTLTPAAGELVDIPVTHILSAGTSATGILAIF